MPKDVVAIADDLSGAAETAAALGGAGARVELVRRAALVDRPVSGTAVLDCDARYLPAPEARQVFDRVLAGRRGRLFVKVDSLLRGNIAAAIGAAVALDRPVVIAPALPTARRTVSNGRLLIDGRPLATTDLWRAEAGPAPERIADLLPGGDAVLVPLEVLRAGGVGSALQAPGRPPVLVVDAVTSGDLRRVVQDTWTAGQGTVVLTGSRGLAEAVGSVLGVVPPPAPAPLGDGLLLVMGSADAAAHRQFDRLVEVGVPTREVGAAELLAGRGRLDLTGASAVRIAVGGGADPRRVRRLAARFAEEVVAASTAGDAPATLVVIGGETGRRILDRLGVAHLTVLGTDGDGTVHSTADTGLRFVSRPGSFGDDDHLVRLLGRLTGTDERTIAP